MRNHRDKLIGLLLLIVLTGASLGVAAVTPDAEAVDFAYEQGKDPGIINKANAALLAKQAADKKAAAEKLAAEKRVAAKKKEEARKLAQQKASRDKVRSSPTPSKSSQKTSSSGSVWDRLAQCESGGRWDYNGSSGYDGGLQFSPKYWPFMANKAGVSADYAWQASREEQIRVAEVILDRQGWGAWPACSSKLGLR
jgi:hypothetical protein